MAVKYSQCVHLMTVSRTELDPTKKDPRGTEKLNHSLSARLRGIA